MNTQTLQACGGQLATSWSVHTMRCRLCLPPVASNTYARWRHIRIQCPVITHPVALLVFDAVRMPDNAGMGTMTGTRPTATLWICRWAKPQPVTQIVTTNKWRTMYAPCIQVRSRPYLLWTISTLGSSGYHSGRYDTHNQAMPSPKWHLSIICVHAQHKLSSRT